MNEEHPQDPALTRPDGSPLPAEGSDPQHELNTRIPAQGEMSRSDPNIKGQTPGGRRGAWLATEVTPAWAGRAIVGVGVLAGATLVGEALGLGVAVVLLALGAIVLRLPRLVAVPRVDLRKAEPPPRDAWTRVWWVFAAVLALVPVLRAAEWVVVPCLFAAAALASLAASGGRRWGELFGGLGAFWARLPVGSVLAGRAAARGVGLGGHAGAAARGAALAVVLLAVFVPLLASADAAFAQLIEDAVPAADQPFGRIVLTAVVISLGGALTYVRLCPPVIGARPPRYALSRFEWAPALGALVALFAAFVALQLTTLFGGNEHVLDTAGLTYAQYARSGFWQLLAVAALTFAVVAAAQRWAGREPSGLLTALLAALCLLTLVVLASALKRLGLLEETYGFTRLRFAAHVALLWLGALFVLVLAARAAAAPWLPRAIMATTAAAFIAFALADPERRIADANVARFERTGQLDYDYLYRLGPDAAPALTRLPGPQAACVRDELRRELGEDGVAGFNLARTRARDALKPERCAAPRTRTVR